MKRSYLEYIRDIRDAMETACSFVEGMKYSDYAIDTKTNMAVGRAITIIGEASRNVPDEIRMQFPAIPWAWHENFRFPCVLSSQSRDRLEDGNSCDP